MANVAEDKFVEIQSEGKMILPSALWMTGKVKPRVKFKIKATKTPLYVNILKMFLTILGINLNRECASTPAYIYVIRALVAAGCVVTMVSVSLAASYFLTAPNISFAMTCDALQHVLRPLAVCFYFYQLMSKQEIVSDLLSIVSGLKLLQSSFSLIVWIWFAKRLAAMCFSFDDQTPCALNEWTFRLFTVYVELIVPVSAILHTLLSAGICNECVSIDRMPYDLTNNPSINCLILNKQSIRSKLAKLNSVFSMLASIQLLRLAFLLVESLTVSVHAVPRKVKLLKVFMLYLSVFQICFLARIASNITVQCLSTYKRILTKVIFNYPSTHLHNAVRINALLDILKYQPDRDAVLIINNTPLDTSLVLTYFGFLISLIAILCGLDPDLMTMFGFNARRTN